MTDVLAALESIAAARGDDPLAPVTLVVPSHVAALQMRRRLADFGPFAGVRFETLPRIAELLGAGHLAAAGRAPLARPIGDYLAERVARESRGVLSQVGDLPGYARVLRQMFRRLRRGGLHHGRDAAHGNDEGHLGEVLRLYDRFREETAAFYDEEDLLEAAAEGARSGQAGAVSDLGSIYVVPPGAQSAGAEALLSALREVAPAYVELEDPAAQPEMGFVLAPDPASEVREVVREVVWALESGLSPHEIAVFHGADPAYRRLLQEAFDAADIPVVPLPGVPLSETPAGRGALALALLPARDFSRTATIDFLSVAPLREWLPTGDGDVRALTSVWDRLSREAGITHGTDRWSDALQALIADQEAELASSRVAENEGRQRAIEFRRGKAQELKAVVEHLASRLELLTTPQPAAEFVPAFKRVIGDYFDPAAHALDEVMQEIDQLGSVGAVGGSFSLASFAQSLAANLETATIRERNLGDGIMVSDYRAAAELRFKRVLLCGAYEGAFPAGPGADALVQDSAWSRLRGDHPYIEDSSLRIQRAKEAAERAVAVAAQGKLVWSAPMYEPGGTREYYPSPMMVAAAAKKDADIQTATDLRRRGGTDWLRRGPSPLAMMLLGPVVDPAEVLVRRAVLQRKDGARVGSDHPRWKPLSMLRARRGRRFTDWDGNLGALTGDAWLDTGKLVSPTSLEQYSVCGFRYLCRSLLRLNAVEEPEEREVMDAAARGTLIHKVLDTFFRQQQKRGRPAVDEAWTEDDLALLLRIMERELAEARRRGQTGLEVYSQHEARAMRADLETFLEKDTAFRRETGAVPADFETPIPQVSVAGVTLRGYVDRVDRSPDGKRAWVIDYKTGSKRNFEAIKADDDPFAGGTKLQLPTYVEAAGDAEEVNAAYWFITHKGGYSFIGYEPTPERKALFERTLTTIVDGVRAGAFPAVPGEEDEFYGSFQNCTYCDYDRICSRRRDYEYEAKVEDEAISPWLRVGETACKENEE